MNVSSKKTERNRIKAIILKSGALIITGTLVTIVGISVWIKTDVNSLAQRATERFQQDKIESLLAMIESDEFSLKEKNHAVWALGIFKDERALPKLESLHSGQPCNHETEICQYELRKAILKIKREFRGSWQASN